MQTRYKTQNLQAPLIPWHVEINSVAFCFPLADASLTIKNIQPERTTILGWGLAAQGPCADSPPPSIFPSGMFSRSLALVTKKYNLWPIAFFFFFVPLVTRLIWPDRAGWDRTGRNNFCTSGQLHVTQLNWVEYKVLGKRGYFTSKRCCGIISHKPPSGCIFSVVTFPLT